MMGAVICKTIGYLIAFLPTITIILSYDISWNNYLKLLAVFGINLMLLLPFWRILFFPPRKKEEEYD
jgi:hypothetical protein